MKFNKLYFKEYKDQFNFYNLIKKINPNYKLYFNFKDKMFAIVNTHNNYEICKVFDGIFNNLINDLRFYKIENCKYIFKFIDDENDKMYKKQINILSEKQQFSLSEMKKLSNRSTNINQNDINKIIGA